MEAWFFFILLLPLILIFNLQKNKEIKKNLKPPGPAGLPLVGNLHQFDSAKPHEFFSKLAHKFGPLVSLRFGVVPVLVISSAKTAREALTTKDLVFSDRPLLVGQQKLTYNGRDVSFSPYGGYWREMRKISVVHLFSLKRIQSFRPILDDEVCFMINKISKLSSLSQVINLSSIAMNLTITVISQITFGKKYAEEDYEKKKFEQMLREGEALLVAFFVSDYLPSLGLIDKLSGMLARLEKNFRDFDLFYEELIEEHLNPNRPYTMTDDILDLLIQLKNDQRSPSHLTWDHLKALLMDIFVAGTDASAATIVSAMTALMQAPTAMKRVQSEIRDLVGKKGTIREETLQELPYLDAVIKETFRLYPPVPILPRKTRENCKIERYDIEAKTMVFINAWGIARDPESWENPEDFIPERFLNSSIDVKGNDFEFLPFGAGRRGCPGISLGLSTVKVALANLLYSFEWELPPGMKVDDMDADLLPGIVMHKKNALRLVAKKYA